MLVQLHGQSELGAHTVGTGNQNRLVVSGGNRDHGAEAAETAQDLRATGARCGVLDSADEFIACIDIDASIAVGQGGLLFAHGVLNRWPVGQAADFNRCGVVLQMYIAFPKSGPATHALGHGVSYAPFMRIAGCFMSVSGQKPAHRSVSRAWFFALFAFLLVGFSAQATAVTVSGLYSAKVPVEGSSPGQLAQGYADGLSQVLVRVSGTRDVLAMEGVETLLSDAESLLLSYQVARDESGQSVLSMSFGAVGVNRALASIDAPVWGANRPLTLAWIAAEDRGSRTLVTRSDAGAAQENAASWRAAFDEAARKRACRWRCRRRISPQTGSCRISGAVYW